MSFNVTFVNFEVTELLLISTLIYLELYTNLKVPQKEAFFWRREFLLMSPNLRFPSRVSLPVRFRLTVRPEELEDHVGEQQLQIMLSFHPTERTLSET